MGTLVISPSSYNEEILTYVIVQSHLVYNVIALFYYTIYYKSLWFDVTLQSDARKVPVETSVSAQLYVMIPDSLCCPGKDNRPQNQHR